MMNPFASLEGVAGWANVDVREDLRSREKVRVYDIEF